MLATFANLTDFGVRLVILVGRRIRDCFGRRFWDCFGNTVFVSLAVFTLTAVV